MIDDDRPHQYIPDRPPGNPDRRKIRKDAKREACLKAWHGRPSMELHCGFDQFERDFGIAWDAAIAHERAKYTALVEEAAQRYRATEANLETAKEAVRAKEDALAAAVAEIGGDDGQG